MLTSGNVYKCTYLQYIVIVILCYTLYTWFQVTEEWSDYRCNLHYRMQGTSVGVNKDVFMRGAN